MPKPCLIISGGQFSPFSVPEGGAFVIACDRGYDYARRCGITPDLVVSDFDSSQTAVEAGVPVRRLPTEKDDTDTMSALRFALEHGFREIHLVCALGGRLDHTLANLQTAADCALRGERLWLCDALNRCTVLAPGAYAFDRMPGRYLSLFACSERVAGLTLTGTLWSLLDADLTSRYPLGVSNEWTDDTAALSFREGLLTLVFSRDM